MTIPEDKLKKWRELRSHGEATLIAKKTDHPATHDSKIIAITRAFRIGRCPDWVYMAMNAYYTGKEIAINDIKKTDEKRDPGAR